MEGKYKGPKVGVCWRNSTCASLAEPQLSGYFRKGVHRDDWSWNIMVFIFTLRGMESLCKALSRGDLMFLKVLLAIKLNENLGGHEQK